MGSRLFLHIHVKRQRNASQISRPCTMHTSMPNKKAWDDISLRTMSKKTIRRVLLDVLTLRHGQASRLARVKAHSTPPGGKLTRQLKGEAASVDTLMVPTASGQSSS